MKVFVCAVLLVGPAVAATTCESLTGLKASNLTVTSAQSVAQGGFTPPSAPQGGQPSADFQALPAFCRVRGVIQPSPDSHIELEIWLPASGWNGRYEGLGNGGFAGSIDFGGLADAVGNGYAASATDTGHRGNAVDGRWALGHPEKVVDFGYRAIHETADKAKAVILAFYGSPAKYSYFSSCSNGGREALMEAQRFPGDYDGILAGAPANFWTHLLSSAAAETVFLNDAGSRIPPSKIPAIQAATLAACDAQDGVKDGVINDPSRCQFDPSQLICGGAETDKCLTAPQVASLKKLYLGVHDSTGKPIFPGRVPGGEGGGGGWGLWITGPAPGASLMYGFSTQFFSNFVFQDAAWDYHTLQTERDTATADEKLARTLNATDPDLKRFRDHGGKLIIYHGWNDPAISPLNSIDYLRAVDAKMGAKQAAGFVRLYLAPGMQHCGGGPGPDDFGQGTVRPSEAQHSISKALERWVENHEAPAGIIATKFKADGNPSSGVLRTRPLCPYPQVARYSGAGSTDDASHFSCVEPR